MNEATPADNAAHLISLKVVAENSAPFVGLAFCTRLKLSSMSSVGIFYFATCPVDKATLHLVPMEVYGPIVWDTARALADNLVWIGGSRPLQRSRVIGNESDSGSRCEKNARGCKHGGPRSVVLRHHSG
jgi:hypothetical protein